MKNTFLAIAAAILILSGSVVTANAQGKRSSTAPKAGIWRVSANDEQNTDWKARLTLIRRADGRYRGHFYWVSADKSVSGREYFNGRFDRRTGRLRLRAYAVKNIKGELGIGVYFALVTRHGRNIRGKWNGGDSIPGKWSAVWLKAR